MFAVELRLKDKLRLVILLTLGPRLYPHTEFSFKNSRVCSVARASVHLPLAAARARLTSRFQDHLVLETTPVSGSSCIGQFRKVLHPRPCETL